MKKTYIYAAVCLMAFAGCDNKEVVNVPVDGIRMTLATDCPELVTRATEPGDDDLNENLISSIHYYFFDTTTSTGDTTYVFDGVQNVNSTGSAEFALSGITNTIYDNIFSSGSRTALYVFVVANAGSATLPSGTGTDLDDIRKAVLALTDFGKQDNFVMNGAGTLAYTGSGSNKTAETNEIKLSRVASKLTMHLIIPNSYTDLATKEWIPQLNKIQIDFKNIGKNGLVSGAVPTTPIAPVFANVTRKGSNVDDLTSELTSDAKSTEVSLTVPVYSYPREWENGDASTPYIYITLPWVFGAVESPTYYKILLPGNTLDPNCWYDISATLGGLGSLTKEGTVTVDLLNINVSKDWKDAIGEGQNNTDADLALPSVLAVEQNTYILYNQNSISIPFISSHDCTLTDATNAEITSKGLPANQDSGAGTAVSTAAVDNAKHVINFTHNLTNMPETGTTYDYKEFIHTYKLYHASNSDVYEFITIIQRPALCVTQEQSYTNTIFIDGAAYNNTANRSTYRVIETSSTTCTSVQRITASVLPTEGLLSNYVLADPRNRNNQQEYYSTYNKQGTSNSIGYQRTSAKHIDGRTGYQLTYSFPSDINNANCIAPEFIVCSGYPGVHGYYMGVDEANVRCATYQEAGYPAGRWRLPTTAEMTFVAKLQGDGKITTIFNDGYDYVASDGYVYHISSESANKITKNTTGSNTTKGSVRCVYDSWYWDNTAHPRLEGTARQSFTWGDEPISW